MRTTRKICTTLGIHTRKYEVKLTNRRSIDTCFSLYSFAREANSRYVTMSKLKIQDDWLTDFSLHVMVVAESAELLFMLKFYLEKSLSTQGPCGPVLLPCS